MSQLIFMVKEEAQKLKVDHITSACDVFTLLNEYSNKEKEHFLLITVDGGYKVIQTRVIHIGTLNQSLVHPREVFRPAILDNVAEIIIAYNHPSNTLVASRADTQITSRLKEVEKLVGIELLDHVILAEHNYKSHSGLMKAILQFV